ncbi:MAG TPA: protein TolQ [Burkholderiaceae bacterium]|jgi:biopolymer transport protein TolQ|nr:protein TolQ [Burkholderiaceae bacterium]HRA78723.1 protein TolQ [Burkholderiaceae bacterium]
MNSELSIVSLVAQASLLVQLVMALLMLVSLGSWSIIFRKWFAIRTAKRATDRFETEFWKDRDLGALYQQVRIESHDHGSLARIFESGMGEFLKTRQQKPGDINAMLDGSRRAMRAAYQREMDALESSLAFLASAGSVSPYIGLFGTVWGIMNSFRGLANVHQATLASVAPGIAEALVATAIGLFAAIPAVVAYNRFAYDMDRLSTRFDSFIDEFSNILQRQAR